MPARLKGKRTDGRVDRILRFIRTAVSNAGATGVVLGISGGVDSAVVGELCVRALGKRKVMALIMPSSQTVASDLRDAKALVRKWGVRSRIVPIDPAVRAVLKESGLGGGLVARGNLQARMRMSALYYFANTTNRLVVGTGDRSEIELGYFTKFGDGGADLLPIGNLYKTEVRELGRYLGIPNRIIAKPSSPGLWKGHRAEAELGAPYEILDAILADHFGRGVSITESAAKAGVPVDIVRRVVAMHASTAHKRALPPIP